MLIRSTVDRALRGSAVVLACAALLCSPRPSHAQQPKPPPRSDGAGAEADPYDEPDPGKRDATRPDKKTKPEEPDSGKQPDAARERKPARGGADEPAEAAGEEPEPSLKQARDLFLRGAALVKKARWSEALAAFERSAKLRSHAVTTYNIGACLRAMGHYLRARKRFAAALEQDASSKEGELSDRLRSDTKAFIQQIDDLLARLQIELKPRTTAIAIDGRPLEVSTEGQQPVLLAGTLPAGRGKPPPQSRFDVLVDPGARVITLSRKGYRDTVVNRTFAPGSTTKLKLHIDKLPATLAVKADREEAIVKVNGADVGYAPVEVSRPGGLYKVLVEKDGFVPYETSAKVDPGEHLRITATLPEEEPGLHEQWWFWTAVGVVVTGTVLITYFATRPEPERPAPDGGGLGWAIEVP